MNSSSGAHALAAAPSRRPPGPVEDPEGAVCIICAEDIDHLDRLSALGPCGHRDTCSTCALRLRYIHKDLRCPTCNVEAKAMAVLPSRRYGWDAITSPSAAAARRTRRRWRRRRRRRRRAGNAMNAQWPGGSLRFHAESDLFMPDYYREEVVEKLIGFRCSGDHHGHAESDVRGGAGGRGGSRGGSRSG